MLVKEDMNSKSARCDDDKSFPSRIKMLDDNILIRNFSQQPLNGQLMARNIDIS